MNIEESNNTAVIITTATTATAATAIEVEKVGNLVDNNVQFVGEKLAPYNPTNIEAIETALDLLNIQDNDIVYDLGCGDARFLVQAWKRSQHIRAIGVEYDAAIYQKAIKLLHENNLQDSIQVLHDNVLNIDVSDATALFVYLVPDGMKKMREALINAIERGARVVTYVFSIPNLTPTKVELYKSITKIYLYKKEN